MVLLYQITPYSAARSIRARKRRWRRRIGLLRSERRQGDKQNLDRREGGMRGEFGDTSHHHSTITAASPEQALLMASRQFPLL
jgi:hypothetical protein